MVASIILCDFACWYVITGGRLAWLVAVVSVVVLVFCNNLHYEAVGEWEGQFSAGCSAILGFFGSIAVVLLLPLAHVGRYSGFGAGVALVFDGLLGVLIAGLAVYVVHEYFPGRRTWY